MTPSRKLFSLLVVTVIAVSTLSLIPGNSTAQDGPVIVTTDKDVYAVGDTVHITVTVVGPIHASFSSTCQCYFVVEDLSGNVVYDLRHHVGWFQILTSLHLGPGATKDFNFTWNQKDDVGNQVPANAGYVIWGYVAGWNPMDEPVAEGYGLVSIGEQVVFALALAEGWNLVSVPLIAHGYNANTLGLTPGDMVVGWNSSTQSYDRLYVVGLSPDSANFPIELSTGYWVYSGTDKILSLSGSAPAGRQCREIDVPATGGWVIIGLNTLNSTWRASMIPDMYSGGDIIPITTVVGFDPITGQYRAYFRGFPITDFTLVPGNGYWCWCTASGTLCYDS